MPFHDYTKSGYVHGEQHQPQCYTTCDLHRCDNGELILIADSYQLCKVQTTVVLYLKRKTMRKDMKEVWNDQMLMASHSTPGQWAHCEPETGEHVSHGVSHFIGGLMQDIAFIHICIKSHYFVILL